MDKANILFRKRQYNLKYRNRHRKHYKNYSYDSQLPCDFNIMRNKQMFNEGFNLR
jgi:hypothetical protein